MPQRNTQISADRFLLTRLVCPLTGGLLILSKDKSELYSRSAKLSFPIRDGIPILVTDEARELTPAELKKIDR
ncbi:MAG: Trm112 family protein [Salaquimonas sp.]